MTLFFQIEYTVRPGELLHVLLSGSYPDGQQWSYNLPMTTADGQHWSLATTVLSQHFRSRRAGRQKTDMLSFGYHYQVEDAEGRVLRREWTVVARRCECRADSRLRFADRWRDVPVTAHLYTLAGQRLMGSTCAAEPPMAANGLFTDSGKPAVTASPRSHTVVLTVQAPQLQPTERLVVTGNHPALGDWQPARGLAMRPRGRGEWIASFDALAQQEPIEYKFVVVDDRSAERFAWEEGLNRSTADSGRLPSEGEQLLIDGGLLRMKEPDLRAAGVMVPLFALRSENSCGVGDLGDLLLFIEWAAKVGLRVVQLLPLNDTTTQHSWHDSAPYNTISAYALHPQYLDLRQLPLPNEADWLNDYHRQCRELNSLEQTDYVAVERVKWTYINKVYELTGEETLSSPSFKEFYEANEYWLEPYAAFCVLRDKYGTARTSDWGSYAQYDIERIRQLSEPDSPLADAVRKICFVQYFLHLQLGKAAQLARSKGVVLKADLPVAPYRDSVATWLEPEKFNLDMQLGTPPTPSAPSGQVWGFATTKPAYRHEWLGRHLRYLEQYFDAVRIDHVAAYFAAWEVPCHAVTAVLGHPLPAHALSAEEIRSMGFEFDARTHCSPMITDTVLDSIFADEAPTVAQQYLRRRTRGNYAMQAEFSTQQKITDHFGHDAQGRQKWLRDGLCRLLEQVLFVEDPRQAGLYHPRLMAVDDYVATLLSADQRRAFAAIHDDYYRYRNQMLWATEARRNLSELQQSTSLLLCVEDLGALPEDAAWVFDSEKVLTLEVLTVGKHRGSEFSLPAHYPYRSVATTSTHDMQPLRLWWQQDSDRAGRLLGELMHSSSKVTRTLSPGMAEEIVVRLMGSRAMLCVLPLQDWLAIDGSLRSSTPESERINNPSDGQNRWCYRMPATIERLMADGTFCRRILQIVENSRR